MKEEIQKEVLKTSKYVHQKIGNIINSELAHNDITAAQSYVLMFIMCHEPPVYPSDIQREMNIAGATVSGLVKKLRAKGYLTMEGCDTDERRRGLIATEKAAMHKAEIENCMVSIEGRAFKGFEEEELETLNRLLSRMADNLKDAEKEGQDK
ncbi:MarR family winged helix-turn-helix transcriptional regulator [Ruminococcus albus]|uniref:DNA-binding transcriptional regulator, MarR family n=1 Tax=Ruminococcus albus TaxID=1264 RepID=A0A1I1D856_RUMAL|nr:MarR family winged helix-turn-helix transcriptional regulator [Ruminococcus albus]SFB70516.1 DNA-binding transcriptional regulator, MarR family [Ruminococcus albus]